MPQPIDAVEKDYIPTSVIAAISIETLLNEGRSGAYEKPSFKFIYPAGFSTDPMKLEIDRDRDGRADSSIELEKEILQDVETLKVDEGNNGTVDYTVKLESSFWRGLQRMTVDKNNDGKIDMSVNFNRNWIGSIKSIDVDLKNDGKVDGVISLNYMPLYGGPAEYVVNRSKSNLPNLTFRTKDTPFSGHPIVE